MRPAHPRWPSQIIGKLLTGHPEAASLLVKSIHCQALARSSAANVGQEFAAAQKARLHYEELRHMLDPCRGRTIHFGAGLPLLLVLGTGLTMLNGIELSGLLGGMRLVLVALAATAVWLTGGWLAALASRERRWPLVLATINTAIFLALLLMTLHGLEPRPDRPAARDHLRGYAVSDVLAGFFILVFAVGAAAFVAHMESASRISWPGGPPTAKRVIYLFQSGAPSQIDLFDYKPALEALRAKELPDSIRQGQRLTGMTATQTSFPVAPSLFHFAQYGRSGPGFPNSCRTRHKWSTASASSSR